jgi:hypothetical protein
MCHRNASPEASKSLILHRFSLNYAVLMHRFKVLNFKSMHFCRREGIPIGMGGLDVVSVYTHLSAPSDHFERGAMATGDRVWKSLIYPSKGGFGGRQVCIV